MEVTVEIPSVLRDCCGGARQIRLSASTAQAVLDQLRQTHPALHRSVCDETGAVRPHVNLFRNSELIRDHDEYLATLVAGDVISIFQAVSGG